MINRGKMINKVCSFYINDLHFITMTLPYINQEIEKGVTVINIFENEMLTEVENILSRMNLKEETKQEIKNIGWTSTKTTKYSEVKTKLIEHSKNKEKITVFIKGNPEYMSKVDLFLEKMINEVSIKAKEINLIHAYEVGIYPENESILEEHEFQLNTLGITKISIPKKHRKISE